MTTSINTTKVYDEIIDFIAAGTTPESFIDFIAVLGCVQYTLINVGAIHELPLPTKAVFHSIENRYKLSHAAQDRLEDLVYAHQTGELTPEEKKELDQFLTLEHIMRLAKARAYKYITAE